MWFEYDQSNPGGSYLSDMPRTVLVEGKDADDADSRAEEVGVYFEGIDSGRDCSCCNDRWSRAYDDNEGRESAYLEYWSRGGDENKSKKAHIDNEEEMKAYFAKSFLMIYQGDSYDIQVVPIVGGPTTHSFDAEGIKAESEKKKRNAAEKLWGVQLYSNGTVGSITRHFEGTSYSGSPTWYDKTGNNDLYGKGKGFNSADGGGFIGSATFGSKDKKETTAVQKYWTRMRAHMVKSLKDFPANTKEERQARKHFIEVIG